MSAQHTPACAASGDACSCNFQAQHTPGPIDAKVERIKQAIDRLTECAEILPEAAAFTHTVERFLRAGDIDEPRKPPSESEVIQALYALRATIAKATGSAA